MKYRTVEPFWTSYARLPAEIRTKAEAAFRLFQQGAEKPPFHPSLRVRKMEGHPGIWEGHITLDYVFTFHVETDPATGEAIFVFRNIGTPVSTGSHNPFSQ